MFIMRFILSITTLLLLLAFGSVLFVSTIDLTHSYSEHGMSSGMTNCPFMAHGETLCRMTALDHLIMLRSIFETVLPSIITLTLIVGVVLVAYLYIPKLKPLLQLHAHTFWRWRISVSYRFSCRSYQDLFSQGILHPKLFS